MHNAWCIYLHFGSLGGFHVSKLYHTIPCMIYLLLHFWLFLVVTYGKCNQDASIDIIYIECLGWFFITMTNYAKPPFCFFLGCFLLNVGIYHIYHGVIIPPFGVISPCWSAPPWSSKNHRRDLPPSSRYWSSNRCTMGDACNFAHSDTELREQPDLVPRCVGWGSFAPCAWMSGWKLGSLVRINGLQLKYIQFFE